MSTLHPFLWGALGAAFFWVLALLACVIWFGLGRWAAQDDCYATCDDMVGDAPSKAEVTKIKQFIAEIHSNERRPL
ncbi:MAG: hypothetical protein K2Q07_10825 [Burkholderiaceae bacterium]|nr:hypothetical protein [Burkholderiaceae bacterium]